MRLGRSSAFLRVPGPWSAWFSFTQCPQKQSDLTCVRQPSRALRVDRSFSFFLPRKIAAHANDDGRFESLEQRAMLIVGANANVVPAPLNQYTGVVHLAGDTANFPLGPRCSATLMESGRHILPLLTVWLRARISRSISSTPSQGH